MMSPSLSIVIPSYARADLLTRCLETVTRFAPSATEVIVVDDASRSAIISQTADRFPGVRVIRLAKRSGFCIAANTGVQAATGDVVELLNDDTEVTLGWADAAVRWFFDPTIAAVAPLVLQNDLARRSHGQFPRIDSAGDEYDPGGFARKRGHGHPMKPDSLSGLAEKRLNEPGPVWGVSAAAGFYRRNVFLAVGGFPEHFGAYFEDVDLSFRLRHAGFETWYDPESLVWHRVSATYGKRPGRRTLMQQSCNEERVFWRNVPQQADKNYLFRHLLVLAGKALRRMEEGSLAPWTLGRIQAAIT